MNALAGDPFGERGSVAGRRRLDLLGCRFEFHSDEPRLLALVDAAYAGLPPQRLPRAGKTIYVHLRLGPNVARIRWRTPPVMRTRAAGGLISGVIDAGNCATLAPALRTALIVFSPQLLASQYHARYELLEFCVYTLATRCRALVPLHGAVMGSGGRGVLLLGASGAGKSTLVLHGLLHGMQLLSEDAVFVDPQALTAVGVPSFLHLRTDALRWLQDPALLRIVRQSARIRRRSGVRKIEVDLRQTKLPLALRPMRVVAVVLLSANRATTVGTLRRLSRSELQSELRREQAFAATQPGWREFLRALHAIPAYELRRLPTPKQAAAQLRRLCSQ